MRFLPFALFLVIAVLAYCVLTSPQRPQHAPQLMTGKPLPAIALPTVDGGDKKLISAYIKGKPVMINFFASWCAPCRHEISVLQRLKEKKILPVIGIAWKDKTADTEAMLAKYGNPYDVILSDLEGVTTVPFALTGVPEMFIVGANGVILSHSKSMLTDEVIQEDIIPLLEQKK